MTALYRFPRSIGPRYNGAAVYYRGIAKIFSSDRALHHLPLHNDKITLSLHCGPLVK